MRIHFVRTAFSIFFRSISSTIVKAAVPIYEPTARILVATFCIPSELIGSSCFLLACRSIRRRFFLVAGLRGHASISSSIPSGYPGKLFPSRLFMPMGVLGLRSSNPAQGALTQQIIQQVYRNVRTRNNFVLKALLFAFQALSSSLLVGHIVIYLLSFTDSVSKIIYIIHPSLSFEPTGTRFTHLLGFSF